MLNDRRARIIHLTDSGKALITAAFRKHEADMEEVASGLSASERTLLSDLLKKLGKTAAATDENPSTTKGKNNARKAT